MNVTKIVGAAVFALALVVAANLIGSAVFPDPHRGVTAQSSVPPAAEVPAAAPPTATPQAAAPVAEVPPAAVPEAPASTTADAPTAQTPVVADAPAPTAPAETSAVAEAPPAATEAPVADTPAQATPAPAVALAAGDAVAGAVVAKKCAACHTFDQGGPARVGPNLFGIVGAAVAAHDGFAYSDGLKTLGGTWSEDHLNAWISNPKAVVAKTKMAFAGIKDDQDRSNLIAYLKTLK